MDDDTTVTMTKTLNGSRWSTCLFGMHINNQMCDKFDISFKWRRTAESAFPAINIGFIASTIQNSIGNWNDRLGMKTNQKYSKCIMIGTLYSRFYEYKNNQYSALLSTNHCFKDKDEFTLSFDFINDALHIFHNDNLSDTISLDNVKEIMPGISLIYKGDTVQVTQWNFYKNDQKWS
eukprot:291855_1